ncbi:hypothetical protein D3C73_791620 [compost metagenome]
MCPPARPLAGWTSQRRRAGGRAALGLRGDRAGQAGIPGPWPGGSQCGGRGLSRVAGEPHQGHAGTGPVAALFAASGQGDPHGGRAQSAGSLDPGLLAAGLARQCQPETAADGANRQALRGGSAASERERLGGRAGPVAGPGRAAGAGLAGPVPGQGRVARSPADGAEAGPASAGGPGPGGCRCVTREQRRRGGGRYRHGGIHGAQWQHQGIRRRDRQLQ